MRTDELVRVLARDGARPVAPIGQAMLVAVLVGLVLSAALFALVLHPRPDIGEAVLTPRFLFKLIVMAALAVAAGALLVDAARPLPRFQGSWALLVAPALLLAGVVVELFITDADTWRAHLVGHNAVHCVSLIPFFALAPAAALFFILKRGAPARPAISGAVAGLVAGGIGALFYAMSCPDDSPLFVATWYSIAIAAVTMVSSYAGSKLLRW
ncbi:MAG: NrsF family protein [Gammaproteobacteria bacterium]